MYDLDLDPNQHKKQDLDADPDPNEVTLYSQHCIMHIELSRQSSLPGINRAIDP